MLSDLLSESPILQTAAVDEARSSVPLFVDLDGTLIFTDLLVEGTVRLARREPLRLLSLPIWLSYGRSTLKRKLASAVSQDFPSLPWNAELIQFLRAERAAGRRIVLATASDRIWAEGVMRHLDVFDDVLATDLNCNLKGSNKLRAIRDWCQRHGDESFSYIGDSKADLPIWEQAEKAYVVRPSHRLRQALSARADVERVFGKSRPIAQALIKAVRPQQWVKNLLILVPILLAHQLLAIGSLLSAVIACVTFSMCASSVYIWNDILDLEADRLHPHKRNRPIAMGQLSITEASGLALLLMVSSGLLTGLLLPWTCLATQTTYFILSMSYSLYLKREPLIDVMVLASFYVLRLFMGGLATGMLVSEWLLAFSSFLFLSLAFVKRYAELMRLDREGGRRAKRRGYLVSDLSLIEHFGATSGYLAVLVLALYIHSPETKQLYPATWALWLICPAMLFWISRMWLLAKRRILSEDPVVFAIRDRTSLMVGGLVATLGLLASWPW